MKVPVKIMSSAAAALVVAASLSACGSFGSKGITLAKSNPDYQGAVIFQEHCSGCHTLSTVGAEGSATSILDRVKTNAPNFDYRKETVAQVLYALRNGGFSGEVMPQNLVVGKQAEEVAKFLSKYSGGEKPKELGEDEEIGVEGGEAEASTGGAAVIKAEEEEHPGYGSGSSAGETSGK
jgi:mono/diheme cytochrome c family protein